VLALYALFREGWRGLLRFSAAGIVLGAGVIGLSLLARGPGGLAGLLEAYASFDAAIPPLQDRLAPTVAQGGMALQVLLPLLPLPLLGMLLPWVLRDRMGRRHWELYGLAWLWTLCPVPEILYKWAFPYHFSQAALGLCIFATLGCRLLHMAPGAPLAALRGGQAALAAGVAGLSLVLAGPFLKQSYWHATAASRFMPVMLWQDWASPAVQQSLYLRAAAEIRRATKPGASLMTEAYSTALFPLSGRLPSMPGMGNGSRIALRGTPAERAANQAQVLDAPPDVLALIPRTPDAREVPPFLLELAARYPSAMVMPQGVSPYGGWGTRLYFRSAAAQPTQPGQVSSPPAPQFARP
jgi:hypothetical protein